MSKRFHDTNIWSEDWFIALPRDYRHLWFYIKDNCDHAGIWRPNIITFNKVYDCQCKLDKAIEFFNLDKKRILELDNGRWLILGFIEFQYGRTLNENSPTHLSILNLLRGFNVDLKTVFPNIEVKESSKRPLLDPSHGVKDKDIDSSKLLKEKGGMGEKDFEDLWALYPNKDGKIAAKRHFMASVKNEEDLINIRAALQNYIEHLKNNNTEKKYIKNGSTFFHNWRDWVVPPKNGVDDGIPDYLKPSPKRT